MSLTAFLETGSGYVLRQQMMGAENPPGIFRFDCKALQIPPELYEAVKAIVARRGIEAGKDLIDAARERDPSIGGGADKLSPAARCRLEDELKSRKDQWLAASLTAINQAPSIEEAIEGIPHLRKTLYIGQGPYTAHGETLWTTLDPERDEFEGGALLEGSHEEQSHRLLFTILISVAQSLLRSPDSELMHAQVVRRMWERFGDDCRTVRNNLWLRVPMHLHIRPQTIGQYLSRLSRNAQGKPRAERKTVEQVQALEALFDRHNGRISAPDARTAAAELGLEKGQQVLSWFVQERKRRGMPKSSVVQARQASRARAAAAPY